MNTLGIDELESWDWRPRTTALAAACVGIAAYVASLGVSPIVSPWLTGAYAKLPRAERIQWDSRWPSTLHAVVLTLSTCYLFLLTSLFSDPQDDDTSVLLHMDAVSSAALGFSLGYFITDLFLLVAYYPLYGGFDMGIHHIAALLSVALTGVGEEAHVYALALLATECTTPFVNMRWWLDAAGLRDSRCYVINGFMLLLCWFVGRILLFLAFFAHVFTHLRDLPLISLPARVLLLVVPALLFVLNLLWFKKIVRGAVKILFTSGTVEQTSTGKESGTVERAGIPRPVAVSAAGTLKQNIDKKTS